MLIGARIREERERLRYSQTEFAALGNASKSSQLSWEQGRAFPDVRVLRAWYEAGVDAGYIVTGVRADSTLEFPVLTAREQDLIENFRMADEQCKTVVQAAAQAARGSAKAPVPDVLASVALSVDLDPSIPKKSRG